MFGETELWFVDDEASLARAAAELAKAKVIGVDTESDSFHHYQEKVCLIQFSDEVRDYIVDPLSVPDLSPLGPIFADRGIVKIFHGADYDVVCMKRDFGFTFRNIFDTMIGAQMAALPRVGLADLIEGAFGYHIDKQYQRHDWAKRPLLDEHIQYARGDTHFLLAIREILIHRLKRIGRLGHLREECRILESRKWEGRVPSPHQWQRTKGSNHLSDADKNVLKHVWAYRDSEASKSDRPPFKVLPDHVLVMVAERKPRTMDELERVFPKKASMKRRYGQGIIDAVVAGMEDDSPIAKPEKPRKVKKRGPKARLTGRSAERALGALKNWRNGLMKKDPTLSPVTVASNAVLKEIARTRPTSIEELAAVPDVRKWQVKDYGQQLIDLLDAEVPWPPPPGSEDDEGDDEGDSPKKRRRRRRR